MWNVLNIHRQKICHIVQVLNILEIINCYNGDQAILIFCFLQTKIDSYFGIIYVFFLMLIQFISVVCLSFIIFNVCVNVKYFVFAIEDLSIDFTDYDISVQIHINVLTNYKIFCMIKNNFHIIVIHLSLMILNMLNV